MFELNIAVTNMIKIVVNAAGGVSCEPTASQQPPRVNLGSTNLLNHDALQNEKNGCG